MALQITDVKNTLTINREPVKAFVTFLVDDCLLIRDVKVIKLNGEYFVSMLSKKMKNGVYQDTVALINKETRKLVEEAVLGEYEREIGEQVARR